jgi:hypothetical protein
LPCSHGPVARPFLSPFDATHPETSHRNVATSIYQMAYGSYETV